MEHLKAYFLSSKPYVSVAIIVVAFLAWRFIRHHILKAMEAKKKNGKVDNSVRFLMTIVQYVVVFFIFVVVLQINDVNVSSLVAGIGVVGIIVGYALQDMLRDIIMGGSIAIEEYYTVGDVVNYDGIYGKVVSFNAKVTKLMDVDNGDIFTISNRNITEIRKLPHWFYMDLPAPYEESAERMRQVMKEICEKVEKEDKIQKASFAGTQEFGDSQINYRIKIICDPAYRGPIRRIVNAVTQDVYAEKGIEIPYPQMDVHMK